MTDGPPPSEMSNAYERRMAEIEEATSLHRRETNRQRDMAEGLGYDAFDLIYEIARMVDADPIPARNAVIELVRRVSPEFGKREVRPDPDLVRSYRGRAG